MIRLKTMWKVCSSYHDTPRNAFMFCNILLIFLIKISDAYDCKECESVKTVMNYFHPKYEGNADDVGECTDPCSYNPKLIDPLEIKAARDAIYDCSRVPVSCLTEATSKYRTIDASCNNLKNPSWGMSNNCHRILLPHDYADDVSQPKISCTRRPLPRARVVSNALHRETKLCLGEQTFHFMEWGQLVGHDVALTDASPRPEYGPKTCCYRYPINNDECMGEEVPENDPFYIGRRDCLPFQRTIPYPKCVRRRETLNQYTADLDLSSTYGSRLNESYQLRSFKYGLLKTQNIPGTGELPPPIEQSAACKSLNANLKCFLAGDFRIMQNPLLTSTHLIMIRNHNNIARYLRKVNSHWNDEKLYQEARRINIAQTQSITFGQYIQNVVGPRLSAEFNLDVLPGTMRTKYDPEMDISVIDEVTSAANRYGHSFVPNSVVVVDPETNENSTLCIKDYYFYPFDYYNGLFDKMVLGMTRGIVRQHNLFYASSVRDWVIHLRGEKRFGGRDLAATSVIRGRDHGIPGYIYYLKYLFQYEVKSFCDLKRFIPPKTIRLMREVYESVHDIDLYTGGLSEYHIDGSVLGPTFAALVLIHYQRMKFADRYYFEHGDEAGSFTDEQLLEIKKTTLSRLICETTKISEIQHDVFYPPSAQNPLQPCDSLPQLDFSAWYEAA